MRQRDVAALVNDPGLTPDAVRLVLHVAFKGERVFHPIAPDELSELLEEGGEKRVKKAIERARRRNYLRVKEGRGRGHYTQFWASIVPSIEPEENPSHGDTFSDKRVPPSTPLSGENPSSEDPFLGGAYYGGEDSTVVSSGCLVVSLDDRLKGAGARQNGNGNGAEPSADPDSPDQVIRWSIRLANKALQENPTIRQGLVDLRPIRENGPDYAVVDEWIQQGATWPAIARAVWKTASEFKSSSRSRTISTMKYFRDPVFDEQERINAAALPTPAIPGAPDPVHATPHTVSPPSTTTDRIDDAVARFQADQRRKFAEAMAGRTPIVARRG